MAPCPSLTKQMCPSKVTPNKLDKLDKFTSFDFLLHKFLHLFKIYIHLAALYF